MCLPRFLLVVSEAHTVIRKVVFRSCLIGLLGLRQPYSKRFVVNSVMLHVIMAKLNLLLLFLPLILADCPVSVTLALSDTSKVELSPGEFVDPVAVPVYPGWVTIDGATWMWKDLSHATAQYKFVSTFTIAEWKLPYVTSARLQLAVDDYYTLIFNGKTVAPRVEDVNYFFTHIMEYDLKDMLIGSAEDGDGRVNTLEVIADNTIANCGVAYKLEATFN